MVLVAHLFFVGGQERCHARSCDKIGIYFLSRNDFLEKFFEKNRNGKSEMGTSEKIFRFNPFFSFPILHFHRSNFVVIDFRRFATILCDVDHEVGEEARRLTLQKT